MGRLKLFIPLVLFLLLAILLYVGLFIPDKERLPTALLNRPFPEFTLPTVKDSGRIKSNQDLKGQVALVNVWATWCPTCRAEHGFLVKLSREEQIPIFGVNYKDDTEKANRWLKELHDPYEFSVIDAEGRLGIDLGVYGAPETYLLDADGVIRYKHVGDVNQVVWEETLKPLVEKLKQEAGSA